MKRYNNFTQGRYNSLVAKRKEGLIREEHATFCTLTSEVKKEDQLP